MAGHGLMEGGVEHGDHGDLAHDGAAGVDAGDVGGIVQRGEGGALLDGLHHFVVDEHGGGELLAAVDHAVTDRVDLFHGVDHAVLGAGEFINDGGNGLGMRGHGHVFVKNRFPLHQRRVLEVTVDADALAQPLGHDGLGLHVDELIFEGGAARVDDKNFHVFVSFHL